MRNKWHSLNGIMLLFCFLILFTVDPLGENTVQADQPDNKSVADTFRDTDGQATEKELDSSDQDENMTEGELVETNVDTPLTENESSELFEQSLFSLFFQLFLALAVIIVMIYATIRFIGKRSQSYQAHRTLQNLGGVPVGSNRSVQLVKVGKSVLVVGVGESIQLLKEITDDEEIEKIIEDNNLLDQQQPLSSLVQWVKQKSAGEGEYFNNSSNKSHFKSVLERQLTDVKESQKKVHAVIKEKE